LFVCCNIILLLCCDVVVVVVVVVAFVAVLLIRHGRRPHEILEQKVAKVTLLALLSDDIQTAGGSKF
jgi:hypothetical protein